jgi:RNA recognition motif-containing protein
MNIFISNLNVSVNKQHLKNLFSEFGAVRSAVIVRENNKQLSNTFCWLVMDEQKDAEHAIKILNQSQFMQKTINVGPVTLIA